MFSKVCYMVVYYLFTQGHVSLVYIFIVTLNFVMIHNVVEVKLKIAIYIKILILRFVYLRNNDYYH